VEAGRGAELRLAAAEDRLGVGEGAARDVAPLGVRDHEQAFLACVRDRALEREPAGEAEPLEARELRLDGDARRAGGVDQRERVGQDGGGGV
jgi:hypothetical protein